MASRYPQGHQKDNRTQLFSNVGSYSSAQVLGTTGSSVHRQQSQSPGSYMQATMNSKGQYSDAVLSQLESQNDDQLEGLHGKVKILKDVALKIGDEVRDSNKLINDMEENFENAKVKLRSTYHKMMRMAERSGIPLKTWFLLFMVIFLLFFYVWWR